MKIGRYLGWPLPDIRAAVTGKRVLVVHQQVTANAMAEAVQKAGAALVQTAGWFRTESSCIRPGHVQLKEEEDLVPAGR